MLYCGVDLHAKSSNFCLVNRRGKRVAEGVVPSGRRGFTTLMASGKGEEIRLVLEASTRSRWAAVVLEGLGAEVIVYGHQPDGKNINKECGSMHPMLMCQKVWEHRADLGLAHDGDADRVLLCDERGALIDGDDIMAIASLEMLTQGTLAEKTLVSTMMSNAGLEAAIVAAGGRIIRTGVGDRQVIDEMLRNGFNFGGEQSGHIIFRDYSTTGDGLVAALQILRVMKAKQTALSPC